MSDALLIALISLARSVTTAIMTAMIGPLRKLIERSSAHSATVPVTRPWWQFGWFCIPTSTVMRQSNPYGHRRLLTKIGLISQQFQRWEMSPSQIACL
ncbi:MAG: hypothetical protein EOM24_11285 [Chloroflexia bacterium]|nr:hypothetical protein [Chloroflexia bacterium]